MKKIAEAAFLNTEEDLPGVSAKEAAEMVAAAAIKNVMQQDAEQEPTTSTPSDETVFLEDEKWTLAAYMEGMSEHQDELDAKVRTTLSKAFNTMHEGLDQIEEAHKIADGGIKKQREGLIQFKKIVDNTPLYNVGHLLEEFMGEQVTEEGGTTGKRRRPSLKFTFQSRAFNRSEFRPQERILAK